MREPVIIFCMCLLNNKMRSAPNKAKTFLREILRWIWCSNKFYIALQLDGIYTVSFGWIHETYTFQEWTKHFPSEEDVAGLSLFSLVGEGHMSVVVGENWTPVGTHDTCHQNMKLKICGINISKYLLLKYVSKNEISTKYM